MRRAARTPQPAPEPASIRGEYERHGADAYYRTRGADYRNPHEPHVRASLAVAVERWNLDLTNVLDLAAGSGEVTLALRELGAAAVHGVDPYTAAAYESRTGQAAEPLTFADVAGGGLAGRSYSLIVCSFALHLCETSRLPVLAQQLSQIAPALLVLSPHKRPVLREEWGWGLAEETVLDRVRSRLYRSTHRG